MDIFYGLDQDEGKTLPTFANKIEELLSKVRQMFPNALTVQKFKPGWWSTTLMQ